MFACVTVAFVTFPARVSSEYAGPALTGAAALLALGSGIVVQAAARRREWGPRAGTVGAVLAGLGFLLVGAGGAHPPLWLLPVAAPVLGVAYGLCLREGLLDLESLAPKTARGTLTGVFYVGTYLGFALPVLLVVLEPATGASLPLFALAVPAFVVAVVRARRLVVAEHPRTADVPHG